MVRVGPHYSVPVRSTEVINEDFCFLFLTQRQLMQSTAYDPGDLPDWNDKHCSKQL